MKNKGNRRFGLHLLVWGVIPILAVVGLMVTIQSINASGTKEGEMNIASATTIQLPEIPPIDEAVSSIIETATFGLG